MINRIVDAIKSINHTTHDNKAINSLNYARNIPLTLAEIDHRLTQIWNGLRKLESDVSTIYNYIESLSSKVVTQPLST